MIYQTQRHTIMDGVVVTYATAFHPERGAFGRSWDARGPFEISASRNAVMVHRAELTAATLPLFMDAMRLAGIQHANLEPNCHTLHSRREPLSLAPEPPAPPTNTDPPVDSKGDVAC